MMRKFINIIENALRNTDIKLIDVDDAMVHFDLPVDLSRSEMRRGFSETKRAFMAMFKGQTTITVYRTMDVDEDWQPSGELGSSWSYSAESGFLEKSARAGWVILVGEVSIDDVDWATTIAVNTFHEEEQEIVVERGSPILLKQILRFKSLGDYELVAEPNKMLTA